MCRKPIYIFQLVHSYYIELIRIIRWSKNVHKNKNNAKQPIESICLSSVLERIDCLKNISLAALVRMCVSERQYEGDRKWKRWKTLKGYRVRKPECETKDDRKKETEKTRAKKLVKKVKVNKVGKKVEREGERERGGECSCNFLPANLLWTFDIW